MRRLNSVLAASLCVLCVLMVALSAFPASAQLPGRGDTPTPSDMDEWEVIGVAIRHRETGEVRILPFAVLVAPTPTDAPPTPTATPSATPSATPTATLTPTPSATPDTVEPPTPTPETVEPPPTFTLTPVPKTCVLKNNAQVTNIRSTPTTKVNNIVNKWQPGAEAAFSEFTTAEGYLWGRMAQGWLVVRSGTEWWVYGTQGSDLCPDVAGWPVGLEPPAPIVAMPPRTAWGVWVGQGANTTELIQFGETLKAAGIQPAATVYGYAQYANDLAAAGWQVAYRPFYGDCMNQNVDPVISARARWYDALRLAEGVNWTWLVLNNECTSLDVWWYKSYLAETVRLAEAGNVRGIVPHVFGAGSPELSWFGILQPELARLAGAGGAFGFNSYPVREGMALCSDDPYNAWTTYRYRMFVLPDGLPIVITEFARSWGEAPPDFADVECYVRRVDGWPVVFATAWYDAVPLSPWQAATLVGKLGVLGLVYRNALQ